MANKLNPAGDSNPLRKARAAKGWGQVQTALKLGCSRQNISYWEIGLTDPKDENLKRMAALFGIEYEAWKKRWKSWKRRHEQAMKAA